MIYQPDALLSSAVGFGRVVRRPAPRVHPRPQYCACMVTKCVAELLCLLCNMVTEDLTRQNVQVTLLLPHYWHSAEADVSTHRAGVIGARASSKREQR